MSRYLIDLNGNSHDIDRVEFDLGALKCFGLMPEDYELCGTCGFDHHYDQIFGVEINRLHKKDLNAL